MVISVKMVIGALRKLLSITFLKVNERGLGETSNVSGKTIRRADDTPNLLVQTIGLI